jgi:hypothetical protein
VARWLQISLICLSTTAVAGTIYVRWNRARVRELNELCITTRPGENVDSSVRRVTTALPNVTVIWAKWPLGVGLALERWWGASYALGEAECWIIYDEHRNVQSAKYREPKD